MKNAKPISNPPPATGKLYGSQQDLADWINLTYQGRLYLPAVLNVYVSRWVRGRNLPPKAKAARALFPQRRAGEYWMEDEVRDFVENYMLRNDNELLMEWPDELDKSTKLKNELLEVKL